VVKYIKLSGETFADVIKGAWYENAVSRLVAAGVLTGDSGGKMRPLSNITREETAVIFARVFSLPENIESGFSDSGDLSAWSRGAVNGMKAKGYINGDPNGAFRPKDSIKRCEAVTILDNIISAYLTGNTSYTGNYKGNVLLNEGASISKMTVTGNLYLTEGVGSGTVTLSGVEIGGTLFIRGGLVYFFSGKVHEVVVTASAGLASFNVWPDKIIIKPGGTAIIENVTYENTEETDKILEARPEIIDPVIDLMAGQKTKTEITLSWTPVRGAEKVEVYVSTINEKASFAHAKYSEELTAASASVTVTGLKPNTQYWFKLVINDGSHESNIVNAKTYGYKIIYHSNGATGTAFDPNEYSYQEEVRLFTLADTTIKPPSNNQIFSGWSTERNGAATYKAGETIRIVDDITLYAVWITTGQNA